MEKEIIDYSVKTYNGEIYQAKDNIVIQKRTGKNSVSLSAPVDFVDGLLAKHIGENLEITITVTIKKI